MSNTTLCWALIAGMAVLHGVRAVAAHPLDPLSSKEIAAAVAVLRNAGDIDAATRFALIDLDEPRKADVLAWKPGQPFARKAFVVARRDRTVYEAVVDLGSRRVERWQAIPNTESAILDEEIKSARRITIADAGWQAAMRKRGFDTFDKVFCAPLSVGYSVDPQEVGRRLVRVACFAGPVDEANVWGRPIEGLYTIVDLDAGKVIRVIDRGSAPVARKTKHLDKKSQPNHHRALERGLEDIPKRPNFLITGDEVRWNKWSFHYRMDRRAGLILALVQYDDNGRRRTVLYRGSVAEMFVPYMDPDGGWSFRTYMDEGEYGLGLLSSPLTPGVDCPADATFFDATLPNDRGEPVLGKSVICLFERDKAAPLWRHYEAVNGSYQGRLAVELVLRTIPSVGDYDYIIDWVLSETGVIRIDVGATGIDQVKGVSAASMRDPTAAEDTAYGGMVAPNLVGTNHDHFLSLRLDVDIDGSANTLVRESLKPQLLPGTTGRRSLWHLVKQDVDAEGPLTGNEHGDGQLWRIINPNLTNRLGQHPGYELRPDHWVTSLLSQEDLAQQRAAFSAAALWITAYDPRELYAAGPYPNQSGGGGGLPAYAARHRAIVNADIVLWYTMGFHHMPRAEDWPVLPTMWHSVSLVPYGFFDRNPALDAKQERARGDPGR
jgi:primary-amine oxidase